MPDKTTPFHCPECKRLEACGFHGILHFEDQPPPTCRHHTGPGKPCHEGPVKMVPSR